MMTSVAIAFGAYRGLVKPAALRLIIDGLDEAVTRSAESAALDAQIRELLDG